MKVTKMSYLIAVVLAVLAGLAVYLYQSSSDARALAGKQGVTVVVAKMDLAVGTKLADAVAGGAVGYATYPQGTLPVGTLSTIDAGTANLVVSHAIGAGQLVLGSELSSFVNPNAMIQIPTGRVAVSVNLDEAARVASFVQPGSRVVVYWTPGDDKESRVLLADADVIAVGATSTASGAAASGAGNTSLVTLALTPADAPRVVLATKTGSLYFGLLSDATSVVRGSGVTADSLRSN